MSDNFVLITPGLTALAKHLAALQHSANRSGGVRDNIKEADKRHTNEILGVMGELAYAIWSNLCPDLTCEPRRGGRDFRDRMDFTVDVKTSDGNGDLSVELSKAGKPCDYYVSIVVTKSKEFVEFGSGFCRAEIVGYAWAKEVFDEKHRRPGLGGQDYYRVPRAELHPPDPCPALKGG